MWHQDHNVIVLITVMDVTSNITCHNLQEINFWPNIRHLFVTGITTDPQWNSNEIHSTCYNNTWYVTRHVTNVIISRLIGIPSTSLHQLLDLFITFLISPLAASMAQKKGNICEICKSEWDIHSHWFCCVATQYIPDVTHHQLISQTNIVVIS